MDFNTLNLAPDILEGIADAGFTQCTHVQADTFTHSLAGEDVCVQSQTGTGKTAAFLITIFARLTGTTRAKGKQALVIVPTRELAVQIEQEALLLGAHLNLTIGSFYGGVGYATQEKLLREGVDLIIGTPGRLLDFISSGKLSLKNIAMLVIDEADRLFDMGFLPDIRRILKKMPASELRQTMLFSATLSPLVRNIASEYMEDAFEIAIEPEKVTVDTVTQELYHVGHADKISLLLGLIKRENPHNCLIFTNMKTTAMEVAQRLTRNGLACQYIIGDLPQSKRLKIIDGLKTGKIRFLVATNVAARGLHVDDLDLVVNYDLPEDSEDYIHRIGRTARAGKSGKAISLACETYIYALEGIESFTNTKLPVIWAEETLYEPDQSRSYKGAKYSGKRTGARTGGDKSRTGGDKKHLRKKESGAPKQDRITAARRTEKSEPKPKTKTARPAAPVSGAIEDRLEYYRQKYGEDFKMPVKSSVG